MATSRSWAQDVITCDLCDTPTQQFCNNCQVNLCETCVKKHRDEFKSLMHEIVPFLERKIQLVFPECREHSGQRCELTCIQCNTPVCIKCIASGPHKGHDVEELTEIHEKKIRKIKSDTEEIKAKIIPKYQNEDQNIGNTISKTKSKIDDLGKESKKLRKLWHQEVDSIFDKIDSLSQSLGEENLNALEGYQNKIRNLLSEIKKVVKQNEKLSISTNSLEVSKYQSKLNEYQDFPKYVDLKFPFLSSNIDKGKELSIEIGGYTAILKQRSKPSLSTDVSRLTTGIGTLMDKVRVIATIPTIYSPLYGVFCVGEVEAWIFGQNKTITRIDIHGAVKDTVTTKSLTWPSGISVTRGRELIYSDYNINTVNVFRDKKSETLITTPKGWKPGGLCCTMSGDIIVHLFRGSGLQRKNKIIRYQGKDIKQEINNDGEGNPILKEGECLLYISENNNGDVCVSDVNAGAVVVVDKTGRVRFRYDGTQARREKSFDPRGIVTDALSQIIVTDSNNNCLHILNQNGQFLRCVDDCGEEEPSGLSLDSEGRLWVGSWNSREIKVIEYLQNK
uniref:E3 ubiquitin-protein ligase TRIM71-like n=1 Tax=Crassostrea virginica TaxID=6565 RepID=A0A8B8C5E7_CRAVI|nr:E3 ubiquitin-protein ligase TRIM71-like [Crassostrea virginica]